MAGVKTPDGRYVVVRGRLWRATNPQLSEERRAALTAELMDARRRVGAALRGNDRAAERIARQDVHRSKLALGERGPVWWGDDAPDCHRRMARNTEYRDWYERSARWEEAILEMLDERAGSASICPSEVARRVEPETWRGHMEEARDAARRLARRGEVAITQRGKVLDPNEPWRGAVRIGRSH